MMYLRKVLNIIRQNPYLQITVAGILAFAPVSFMQKALKNDIIALEFPINQFTSQCIHNGEFPYWFNTWGMGFPLHSNLTWGVFSSPRFFFSSVFNYNIYSLHIEFIFFVCMAGWTMYHLLKTHILKDNSLAFLFAISYMLSGFSVGSSQWLLYITAAAFIPLVLSSFLSLLKKPSLKTSLQFGVFYTLMFTSVYAAFNIITTYTLILFTPFFLLISGNNKESFTQIIKYIVLAFLLVLLLCGPPLIYTLELMPHIERGDSINQNQFFFNSNYLHPKALASCLLPLSSAKMNFPNTEGSMLNCYLGLFILLLLPSVFWKNKKENRIAIVIIAGISLLFLLASFGSLTPVRNALNILPGFSHFRNPAIFRLYFIFSCILLVSVRFYDYSFADICNSFREKFKPFLLSSILLSATLILSSIYGFLNSDNLQNAISSTSKGNVQKLSYEQLLTLNSLIQLLLLFMLLWAFGRGKTKIAKLVLISELVINTLLCTPFFSVSSYSLKEMNTIYKPRNGFPVQTTSPGETEAVYNDSKGNNWNNINIFKKEVSIKKTYRGPLTLKSFNESSPIIQTIEKLPLVHISNTENSKLEIIQQKPASVIVKVFASKPSELTLLQNFYPGWHVTYNQKKIPLIRSQQPGITIDIPAGDGIVKFFYKRTDIIVTSIILHLIVFCYLGWIAVSAIRKETSKLLSLS